MDFTFQLSNYNQDDLEAQVCKALEKRSELSSRQRFPGLWSSIDRLEGSKAPKPVRRRRASRYKIYGVVLLALGIFLLVPGLSEPEELLVPLVAGVVCVLMGLAYLMPRREKPSKKFRAMAVKLLAGAQTVEQAGNAPVLVCFSEAGMKLPDRDIIPFDCFDAIVETEGIYLFTWNGRVTILQKRDLITGAEEDFLRFLREKTDLKPEFVSYDQVKTI